MKIEAKPTRLTMYLLSEQVVLQLRKKNLVRGDAIIWVGDDRFEDSLLIPRNTDPGEVISITEQVAKQLGMKAEHAGYLDQANGVQLVHMEIKLDVETAVMAAISTASEETRLWSLVETASKYAANTAERLALEGAWKAEPIEVP
jgi:hypothetical protein